MTRERVAQARLTHPERVLYSEQGVTKRELADYYAAISERMLPYIAGRPLTLVRCPQGAHGQCFYQKHHQSSMPAALHPIAVPEKRKMHTYVMVDDADGLVALAQLGVLEIHIWGSHADDLEHPDLLVFDLDPDTELPWRAVVSAARVVRDHLAALGLRSWVKTTGGKGLHVVVPIAPRDDWEEVKAFCKGVAERIEGDAPRQFVSTMSKARRKGKVFLDYFRNGRGATAIAPYATRAHAHAPIATPVSWHELGGVVHGSHYDIRNIRRRLAALKHDPWEGFLECCQGLTDEMKQVVRPA